MIFELALFSDKKMDSTISSLNIKTNEDNPNETLAYPLNYPATSQVTENAADDSKLSKKMILKCKSCGASFDSTFSSEEFSMLSQDQNRSGTLHLCPNCGNLSIYELKDYQEPK
jgi:predicted RNA-binding Zn-ribbon protein involved in translation (DUF1610 family)